MNPNTPRQLARCFQISLIIITVGVFSLTACDQFAQAPSANEYVPEASPRDEIIDTLNTMVHQFDLDGAALIVRRDGATLLEHSIGEVSIETQVPVASATKWVTAALIMTVIERDGLDLDASLATYLPNAPSATTEITLRQMLSHTSGFAGDHALRRPSDIPMTEAVDHLLKQDLVDAPGSALIYGGVSMQIAGFIAAKQAGSDWQTLYQSRLADPLGWEHAIWDHPLRPVTQGQVTNPNLGAGLHISAVEYIEFLEMLANNGLVNGEQILSAQSITEILRDQTKRVAKDKLPPAASADWGYGLGCWCVEMSASGECLVAQSAGAFGTYPWLDSRTGTFGIVVLRGHLRLLLPNLQAIRKLTNEL